MSSATSEPLGEVTTPSGSLVVVDCGLLDGWRHDPAPGVGELRFGGGTAALVADLPTDRALPVCGVRMGDGDFPHLWRHVEVRVGDVGEPEQLELVGTVTVDCARLLFADVFALRAWKHDESVDGRADYVFWGLHAPEVADALGAPSLGEREYGWIDLPLEEAVGRGTEVEALAQARGLRMAGDFRPHSHHHAILARMRTSPTESGTLDLAGARLCGLFTPGGDGRFPVYRVLGRRGDLVAVRVVLGTADGMAAVRAVNPRG